MKLLIYTILLLTGFTSIGLSQSELEIHMRSIDSTYRRGHPIDRLDTVFNANKALIDYVIENQLLHPEDKRFISNRTLLRKLRYTQCDTNFTDIKDTLENGDTYHIYLETRNYVPNEHKATKHPKHDYYVDIDGQIPYGGSYGLPKNEIEQLSIKVNGKEVFIPHSSFSNFYDPNTCQDSPYRAFDRKAEAYLSLDGNYIYLYFIGSNASGTYFTKLVFDREKYLTKIVVDYAILLEYGSFGRDFLGY